jgi:hypothetical protein
MRIGELASAGCHAGGMKYRLNGGEDVVGLHCCACARFGLPGGHNLQDHVDLHRSRLVRLLDLLDTVFCAVGDIPQIRA